MNLTSGLERWDPYSLWGVASFGLLLGGTLLVTVVSSLPQCRAMPSPCCAVHMCRFALRLP